MRRKHSTGTIITRRRYQTASHVELPDAVDHHAGGKRVLRVRDPFREGTAAKSSGGILSRFGNIATTQSGEKSGLDAFASHQWVPPDSNKRPRRFTPDIHNSRRHGRWLVTREHRDQTLLHRVKPLRLFLRQ